MKLHPKLKSEFINVPDRGFGKSKIYTSHGGNGPPLLLIHGNPMCQLTWHKILPDLIKNFYIVAVDIRGYGDSEGPKAGGENHINYSFRAMGDDFKFIMEKLGFDKFYVAGHDRGARVTHRLCLDYKINITKAAVIDILPNRHLWRHVNKDWSMAYWHWVFMLQPYDFPEKLMSSVSPTYFMKKKLSKPGVGLDFCKKTFKEYVRCFNWKTICASCEDYRASPTCDLDMENKDFENNNHVDCPLLVLWGKKSHTEVSDGNVLETWKKYCTNKVVGSSINGGHYIQEENPKEIIKWFEHFFRR